LLIVPIEEARPGMKLAMTVTHPDHPGQDLLRRNFVLDPPVIAKMADLGIGYVFVDYPGLDDLDKHLAPNLSPERQAMFTRVKATLTAFQRDAKPSVDFASYYDTTRDFIGTLMNNGRNPIYLDQLSARLGGDGVNHAMAVAHLALVMGIKLERYLISQRHRLTTAQAREVVNLGVAGMLHDLGKTKLPEKLRQTHGLSEPEADADRGEWEAHVRVGYDLIRDEVETTAAAAVLHHHQHFDGTGFPAREVTGGQKITPDGERIHVFARILLAADVYERLAVDEANKRRRGNAEILHLMRTRYGRWIDPEVMSVLPKVVPPFPPGSKVKLSDGRAAIVTVMDPDDPYRPTVRPVAADGWTMTGDAVVLSKTPGVHVAEANGVAVAEMLPRAAATAAPSPATKTGAPRAATAA
jgi:hypothetical protein